MPEILPSILQVFAYPLTYVLDRRIKHRDEIRSGVRAPPGHKPANVISSRRRPITPPLPELTILTLRKRPKFDEQVASPLFSNLPAELRLMVWNLCLQETVHVFWQNGHMRGRLCVLSDLKGDSIWGHGKCFKVMEGKGHLYEMRGRLALVITCRRIYSEAINIMYSAPIIDFSVLYLCLQHLPSLILPRRMDQITRVNYIWDCRRRVPRLGEAKLDHFTQVWLSTWGNLAQMKNLKYLKVKIMLGKYEGGHWIVEGEKIVQSLEAVRSRKFEEFELSGLPCYWLLGDHLT